MIWNSPKPQPDKPIVPGVWTGPNDVLLTGRAMLDRLPDGVLRNGVLIPLANLPIGDFVEYGGSIYVEVGRPMTIALISIGALIVVGWIAHLAYEFVVAFVALMLDEEEVTEGDCDHQWHESGQKSGQPVPMTSARERSRRMLGELVALSEEMGLYSDEALSHNPLVKTREQLLHGCNLPVRRDHV